jgi:4-amino-4-deoxy-L-arabinose transferase-like glycosyltransferase
LLPLSQRLTRANGRGWIIAAVGALVLLAFGLRIYAVRWGLPYTEHPDEPSAANTVLRMIRRGDWNPHFFEKPSLYYYMLRLVFAAHLRYGFATGLYKSLADLPATTDRYLTAPELFVWGRMLSIILGSLTVAALYLIGQRWWHWRVGLVAAALLATQPFHMRNSQYITVDVATTLITLLAIGAAVRLLKQSGWRDYAVAGFVAGLAASTKYNAGAVVLSIVVAHCAIWGRASLHQIGRLFWAALWSLLGFLLATPYALLTFDSFVAGIRRQYDTYTPAPGKPDQTWPLLDYLDFFWSDGLRPLPFLSALLGIGTVIARRDRAGLVILAFIPTQVLFFLAQNRHFSRNLLPVTPLLLLFAAIGIVAAATALTKRLTRLRASQIGRTGDQTAWVGCLAAVAISAIVISDPLLSAIELTSFEAQPDSKVRSANYVRERLPPGAPIAVALNPVQWANQPFIQPVEDVAARTADWYRAQGYRYLIVNLKTTDQDRYQALRNEAQVVAVFPGDKDGEPGPPMEALDLGVDMGALAIERQPATFGQRLRLLGFQRGAGVLRPAFSSLTGDQVVPRGQALLLNLYWQPLTHLDADYAIFLHLLDSHGQTVAQRDTEIRATDYPTSHWQPGELAIDLADLPIPADLASGEYRLEMGVYRMDTLERLALPDTADNVLNLMTVTVREK